MDIKDYKIGLYLRVAQKDDEAIERQKELNISYCKYRKYPEIKKIYADNGYSGRTENRPAYKKMIRNILNLKLNNYSSVNGLSAILITINCFFKISSVIL